MDKKQKTILKEVTIKGRGLHTGNMTKMALKPAPANSGIMFVRKDLPGHPVIPALFGNVMSLLRGTTIGINGTPMVYTVEHLLSALNGLGIDNLEIILDNNEPPIFDGSARPFIDYINKAGILELDAPKSYIVLKKPVSYMSDEKIRVEITAVPSDDFKVDYSIEYDHPLIGTQRIELLITPETFINEISSARTFCFDYEIETLHKNGLAKGGGLHNAVVVGMDKIHNLEKLRYDNEFVRHKLLDIIGDLYLLGKPLKAHLKVKCAGHKHHINFVKIIMESLKG
ncbi:MAG: UDP-3-O-[3-hydroxymyristoyl] N-acetylglucosamine deacetylase [Elusimicrobia bacterium RIFOXYB2_FULL_48_7]|nr:MAG: UDP-3-O-[3-hydroxymyristoyl] N-acetylglucosamine deacetylase [Elusimicrobia bacterium RIFOXYB2_FULL_48_7]